VATVGYRFVCKVEVSEDHSGNPEAAGQPAGSPGDDDVEAQTNRGIAEASDPQALIGNGSAGEAKSGRQKNESRGRLTRASTSMLVVSCTYRRILSTH
jgi:hypothetical protein